MSMEIIHDVLNLFSLGIWCMGKGRHFRGGGRTCTWIQKSGLMEVQLGEPGRQGE